ncbi:MAG TPA: ABC transporter ATP-binding protein [Gemmatimonadaceae bacterium]|nr:ABC transporter ATP-binding protein [Gemmatimonadaceae bacterium]
MQTETGSAIFTEGLTRSFGARRAVDGVTISVPAGQALALFGPNGAGKTTLLKMLSGLLKPTSGAATIGGVRLPAPEVRRRVGIVSHHTLLYDALTPRENVEFAARLYGVPDPRAAAQRALERLRIAQYGETLVRTLSRGMKQRVSIARAVVHDPSVILADEPYTGLDIVGARALTDLLVELRNRGAAIILVTHNIDEGLSIATSAGMMRQGRIDRIEARGDIDPVSYGARYQQLVSSDAA